MIKLSIITITFNDPEGLQATLNSLKDLNERNFSWEHIVVDSSPEMNKDLLLNLPSWPLRHLETPPKGIYHAFNLGLEHSRGEWVWFLNGGDRLSSAETLEKTLQETSSDIICAGVKLFRQKQWTYSSQPQPPFISNLMGENRLCHQGLLYKKKVFEKVGPFNTTYNLAGDYDHHFRCCFNDLKIKFSKDIIAEFDRDGRSNQFRITLNEFKKIWKTYEPRLSLSLKLKNRAKAAAYIVRLSLMRSVLVTPFSKALKNLWYWAHRP